jgi:small subunit ribosomal protein S1
MAPDDNNDEDFGKMLAEFEQQTGAAPKSAKDKHTRKRDPKVGDLVRARIVSIGHDAAFVDLGAKAEGMLDLADLRDAEGRPTVKVGDEIEAHIVEVGGKAGCPVLRTSGLGRGPAKVAELESAAQHGIPVEGTVTGVNKGGVEVLVAGIRAFCPISQLDLRHVADATAFIGQKLTFRITKYDTSGRNTDLVLSRRVLLEEEQRKKAATTREKLVAGAVLHGTVTSLKDYGAFVDLGGIEGMIHVSELGFSRVGKPSDVLTPGQPVEVVVLKISPPEGPRGQERIALSLKALEKDPWQDVADRFPAGRRLNATVVRLEQFGAFVELEPGVEGLLHISELAAGSGMVRHAKDKAKVGQVIEVVVLAVDAERHRLSLGLGSKVDETTVDAEGAVQAARASGPTSLGTFGDLLRKATTPGTPGASGTQDKGGRRR